MAKSIRHTIKGKASWAKVFPTFKDTTAPWIPDGDGGQYSITVDISKDELMALQLTGSQSADSAKDLGDDMSAVTVRRPHTKRNMKGEILEWAGGEPKVFDVHGQPWDIDNLGLIGNGSDVEVIVTVYPAGRVIGTRLEEIHVKDHIKYEAQEAS